MLVYGCPTSPLILPRLRRFILLLPSKLREEDKRLHMLWSFWLMLAAHVIWPAPWAFSAVFVLGLTKEVWDHRFGSGFCFFDIVANLLGSGAALTLSCALPGTLFDS